MLSQYHATASAYYESKYLGSNLKVKNDPVIKYVAIGGVVTSPIKNLAFFQACMYPNLTS
jgi:hypothetical protein